MITGSIVAIVSPMFEDGSLDYDSYRQLIDWHIEQGTDSIVAVGTTGESPTVDVEEHGEPDGAVPGAPPPERHGDDELGTAIGSQSVNHRSLLRFPAAPTASCP